jgi:hypothetical protein
MVTHDDMGSVSEQRPAGPASAEPAAAARPAPAAATEHDVYLQTGNTGFYFRNRNRGVTLSAGRIDWTAEGASDGAPLDHIVSVHLQSGGDWRHALRQCRIRFADGFFLMVTDANDKGLPDPAQAPIYRGFVRDLHARLAAAAPGAVRFTAGYTGGRNHVIMACAIVLGLIGVGLPLMMVLITGEIRALAAAMAGGMLCWRLVRMLEANAPRSYQPNAVPQELLG